MTQAVETAFLPTPTVSDLVELIQGVLRDSDEPLTLSKLRARLPARFRSLELEELADLLHRQAASEVFYLFPRYRSQQERFWDRPLCVHIAALLRQTLQKEPLAWSELRRRLPAYAQMQAEEVLREEVQRGRLFRHPRTGRGAERFGLTPPEARLHVKPELERLFARLEHLGFPRDQVLWNCCTRRNGSRLSAPRRRARSARPPWSRTLPPNSAHRMPRSLTVALAHAFTHLFFWRR
jgi:hypothetical protein